MMAATTTPPTTPPAMAAVLFDLVVFWPASWLPDGLVGEGAPLVLDSEPDVPLPSGKRLQ